MNDTTRVPGDAALRYRTILVPTDFSPCAGRAFAYARALARRHGGTLHLVHVLGPVEADAYSPLRHSPEAAAQKATPDHIILQHLEALVAETDTQDLAVHPATRRGTSVPAVLAQYARQEGVDLIVMGTHGRHGVPHLVLGSVAERTVRQAPCSVVTVREGGAAGPDLERILVPVDFSDETGPLLRTAHALAAAYGAQVDLVHVIEPLPFLGLMTGLMTVRDLVPDLNQRIRDELSDRWQALEPPAVPAKLHVDEGHPARRIVDLAAHCGSDLIVIGAQGHGATERFLMGSVVERVVRAAECPVLVHRQPEPEAPEERVPAEDSLLHGEEGVSPG